MLSPTPTPTTKLETRAHQAKVTVREDQTNTEVLVTVIQTAEPGQKHVFSVLESGSTIASNLLYVSPRSELQNGTTHQSVRASEHGGRQFLLAICFQLANLW